MDKALVPHACRLRIGRSNFCLLSDIKSKESTLQPVYDVLRLTPFFKAFLVTADVPEIYMQEFWATATVHHHFIRFKMDNKKHIVEHKDTKKSNEMYYPRFTKVITHHFMSKDPSILRRNKFDALLRIELTNEDIRNFKAYKEYYAVATGSTPPKLKASVRKTRSSSDTTITPPTAAAGPRLTNSEKGKQAAKASKAKSLSALSEVAMTEAQQLKLATKRSLQETHEAQDDDDQEDEGNDEDDEEEGNGEENLGTNVGREEGHDEEEEEDELYRDININLGRGIQMGDVHQTQEFEDSHVTLTLVNPDGQQQSSSVSSQFVTIKVAVQMQSDRLCYEAQAKNDEFLKTIDENMQKIIKVQVKEQVKKMEGNKSIHRSNEQRNLYKALVEAYESDKIILDTYGDTVTLKRRRDDDADKDEEPSDGSDRRSAGKSTQGSKSQQTSASESATAEEPMQTTFEMEEPPHPEFETGADDQPIVEPSQHPEWLSQQKKLMCVEDLQLDVESYQKKLNLTTPDTYRSDLKRKEAYSAYTNPRGLICQNKDKQNKLMWIDELHKFSDGTLTNVRTALDDCLKGIWMKYLPKSIWKKSDKDRATTMIQAIDKMLTTRRIMRSLERFVGGRLYDRDFRMLQRTI
nr:hypothetical protein [Tanacetum cinerariifolium]